MSEMSVERKEEIREWMERLDPYGLPIAADRVIDTVRKLLAALDEAERQRDEAIFHAT